jgi:tRNA U55 pseudouridine synthase TruB
MELPRYVLLDKAVGQTPLQCMETWRAAEGIDPSIPLTYAGRLDPMASGKLLVLIGEECKNKDRYLALDKTYEFSVLLGIGSDTHDVLGRLHTQSSTYDEDQSVTMKGKSWPSGLERPELGLTGLKEQLKQIAVDLVGDIELPYPHFSSKTVQGKPLHMWTLEGRLNEINIPTKFSTIYSLELNSIETLSRTKVCGQARAKIDTIPEVTEQTKSLGNDFRRSDIRQDWEDIKKNPSLPTQYTIAHFTCSASSGTYMRTLSKLIGEQLIPMVPSLAWSIHRTRIENLFK